jgi:hypothetical protein
MAAAPKEININSPIPINENLRAVKEEITNPKTINFLKLFCLLVAM